MRETMIVFLKNQRGVYLVHPLAFCRFVSLIHLYTGSPRNSVQKRVTRQKGSHCSASVGTAKSDTATNLTFLPFSL